MTKIRILLIEDNRILREGIMTMVNKHADVMISATSDGRDDTVKKIIASKPQVVLMDLGLASKDSLEIVRTIKAKFPLIRIIGMGLVASQADIMEFVQTGADGFILKDASMEEVIKTIRSVAKGETVLPPPMTGSLFLQVVEHALVKGKRNLNGSIRMTQREKEIIALIVEGMSNKQISQTLNIATFTVKSHVHNILEKLALHSRLQIANYAREQ